MERKGRKLPICVSLEWTIIGLWICGTQPPELTIASQLPTSAKYAEPGLNLHKFFTQRFTAINWAESEPHMKFVLDQFKLLLYHFLLVEFGIFSSLRTIYVDAIFALDIRQLGVGT